MRSRGDVPLGNGNAIAFSYEGQGCYMHKDEGTEKSCRFLMIVLLMGLVVGVGEVWRRIATRNNLQEKNGGTDGERKRELWLLTGHPR